MMIRPIPGLGVWGAVVVIWLASVLVLSCHGAQSPAQAISCFACGVRGRGESQLPPCLEGATALRENCVGKCYVMFNKKHAMTYGEKVVAKGCTDLTFIRLDDGSDGPCGMVFGDRLNQVKGYNLTYFVPLCLCNTSMCNQNSSACHYSPDNCINPFPWADDKCRRRRGWPANWCLMASKPAKSEATSDNEEIKKNRSTLIFLIALGLVASVFLESYIGLSFFDTRRFVTPRRHCSMGT